MNYYQITVLQHKNYTEIFLSKKAISQNKIYYNICEMLAILEKFYFTIIAEKVFNKDIKKFS